MCFTKVDDSLLGLARVLLRAVVCVNAPRCVFVVVDFQQEAFSESSLL